MSGSHHKHSELAPSSTSRFTKCSASIPTVQAAKYRRWLADEPEPDDDGTPESNLGTILHDLAEAWIRYYIFDDPMPDEAAEGTTLLYIEDCVGLWNKCAGSHYILNLEEKVELFYDDPDIGDSYWLSKAEVKGEKYLFKTKPVALSPDDYTEHKHDKDSIKNYQRDTGTPDFMIYNVDTGELYIRDLKTGTISVSPTKNLQLITYVQSFIREHDIEPISISYGIVQDEQVKETTSWAKEHRIVAEELRDKVDDIIHGESIQFQSSEDICRFCDHSRCLVRHKDASDLATKIVKKRSDFASLSDKEVELVYKNAKEIKKLISVVEDEVTKTAPKFTKLTMFNARRPNRRWLDPLKAAEKLGQFGLAGEDYYDVKMKTPTKLAKEFPEAAEVIAELTFQGNAKPRRVHKDHKGDAIEEDDPNAPF